MGSLLFLEFLAGLAMPTLRQILLLRRRCQQGQNASPHGLANQRTVNVGIRHDEQENATEQECRRIDLYEHPSVLGVRLEHRWSSGGPIAFPLSQKRQRHLPMKNNQG